MSIFLYSVLRKDIFEKYRRENIDISIFRYVGITLLLFKFLIDEPIYILFILRKDLYKIAF